MDTGHVYVWSVVAPQRWSALAPDFMEVEENVEYAERDDEFDIQPAEEIQKRIMNQEDEPIDVLTVEEPASARSRGYGERAGLGAAFRMPVVLDLEQSDDDDDVIATGPGEFRRKEWALDSAGGEGGVGAGAGAGAGGV